MGEYSQYFSIYIEISWVQRGISGTISNLHEIQLVGGSNSRAPAKSGCFLLVCFTGHEN